MKAQQLIELVLEESPLADPNIAELYLNDAQRRFCEDTLILRRRVQLTLSTESLRHTITDPDDIIRIRQLSKGGVEMVNTDAPSYLIADNGFWYVEANTPLTLHVGFWNGTDEAAFSAGETLDMIYEAYARDIADDGVGGKDYSLEPEIPKRFHEALTYRANEKANYGDPNTRRYWHALWRDELVKGRQHANEMHTNAHWNVKVYTL